MFNAKHMKKSGQILWKLLVEATHESNIETKVSGDASQPLVLP